jgi:protein deglycase
MIAIHLSFHRTRDSIIVSVLPCSFSLLFLSLSLSLLSLHLGAEHLRDCAALTALLQKQKQNGKLYAAICAAPAVALHANGLIDTDGTQTATCYPAPAFRSQLGTSIVTDTEANVVVSGNLITSQGPGTALQFALELGQQLYGPEKRKEIADQMLVK